MGERRINPDAPCTCPRFREWEGCLRHGVPNRPAIVGLALYQAMLGVPAEDSQLQTGGDHG